MVIVPQESLGTRYNSGKVEWSLVSWQALEPMVRVLEFGKMKYSAWNWTKGLKVTEICDSLQRHLYAFLSGEDNDPESKLPHYAHLLCNAMFLSYMMQNKVELDDRYKGNI